MSKEKIFNPSDYESKWKEKWIKDKLYATPELNKDKEKFYSLYSFPYPSGAGLHVGHVEGMVANDIAARYYRMKGRNVTLPMGWDSFGLPAENYAIKTGTPPEKSTEDAIKTFIHQINNVGISVDWDKEVGAHRPDYYRWTQWIFLQLYKNGLAYKKKAPVNWCPKDQTVLANEQVIEGKCERCGTEVIQKNLEQWFFKITDFADRLDADLDKVDWPESTKTQQRNWIGKSEGTKVKFKVKGSDIESEIEIFTTRIDTIYGATFMVVAPEHPIIERMKSEISNYSEVEKYITKSKNLTDLERQTEKEKTGVKLEGISAINPFNDAEIPVFTADYVLMTYGTGAIMAVPAHDERDNEFAKKYDISIKEVIASEYGEHKENSVFVDGVSCLIFNKSNQKYLALTWPKNPDLVTLVGGGKNEGESGDNAIKREINEEVGIKSVQDLYVVVPKIYSNYWHNGKKVQRFAEGTFYLIIVDDNDFAESHREAHEDMIEKWFTGKELLESLSSENEIEHWIYATKRAIAKNIELGNDKNIESELTETSLFIDNGILFDSGEYTGMRSEEAIEKMQSWLKENNLGEKVTTYRLRDWLVSRQRYWGCPIPIVYDPEGNAHPLDESDLPLVLPTDVDFLPHGESPIATSKSFKKQAEEKYGKGWHYEVDTMDTFVDSSWYYFRFCDAHNESEIFETPKVSLPEIPNNEMNSKIISEAAKVIKLLNNNNIKNTLFGSLAVSALNRKFIKEHNDIDIIVEKIKHDEAKDLLEKNGYKFIRTKQFERNKKYVFEHNNIEVEIMDSFDGLIFPFEENHLRSKIDGYEFDIAPIWLLIKLYEWKENPEYIEFLKGYLTTTNYWLPTDLYMIGPEHTVLHLLYSRFFTKFFFDQGIINFDEPFYKMRHMGTILGPDGRKMSKRWGNVINPDDEIKKFGADAVRMYEMFIGPLEEAKPWNDRAENGVLRFLSRVWDLKDKVSEGANESQNSEVNKLVKKVSDDIEHLSFNTSVAKFMEFTNFLTKESSISKEVWETFLLLLAPFAPFITEELWAQLGNEYSIHQQNWPEFDSSLVKNEMVKIAIQINGKVRAIIEVDHDSEEDAVKSIALNDEKVKKYVEVEPKKVIYVKNKVINFII